MPRAKCNRQNAIFSPIVVAAIILAGGLCAARAQEPAGNSQKLILGFEKEELLRTDWTAQREVRGEGWFYLIEQPKGFDFAARFQAPGQTDRAWTWACRPGEHTQGEMALVVSVGPANPRKIPPTYRQTEFLSHYYPNLRDQEAHLLMTTFQWFAKGRRDLRDWRGYDVLRIDARSDDSPLELRLAVEDDVVEPPVVTTYCLPQGRWVTIELDLAAAVRARELDLSRIANFWLLGVAPRRTKVRLDNVRLAKRGTPAELDVLRDPRSLAVTYNKPAKPQLPERGELPEPDRRPIELGKPVVVAKGTHDMFGWVAAWDNNHLFVTLADGVGVLKPGYGPRGVRKAFQSRDGGKTWTEVAGANEAVLDHQSTRGDAIDPWGDGTAVASTPGCAGIGNATPRHHIMKYTFTKNGWEARVPDILDADLRHCGWNASVTRILRGPYRGRIWASWGEIDRNHAVTVHVKYSDDDGRTWIPWGRGAELPGASRGWWNDTYMYPVTAVTPYGDHVAVFWQHVSSHEIRWSRYDGHAWSTPESLLNVSVRWSGSYKAISPVTVGEKEVFLTATGLGTVLRWDGQRWQQEPVSFGDGSISLAGETLTVFSAGKAESKATFDLPATRKARLSYLWRSPEGRWEGPITLVPEVKLEEMRSMSGFSVPRYSPPNFVPLAWGDADEGVVKVLRVPIPTVGQTVLAQTAGAQEQHNVLTADEQKAGWKLLFDGKSTAGWRGYNKKSMPQSWKVENGVLTHTGMSESGGDDIVTTDQYENFDLKLQWKIAPGGNSGVMFHVMELNTWPYNSGPEMQVMDDVGFPDGRYPNRCAGSCYDLYAPSKPMFRGAGQWHDARLVVRGNHVEHWLGGEKVVEYERHSADWLKRVEASKWKGRPYYAKASKGYICLQDHPERVEYRDIKIRVLPGQGEK